MDRLDTSKITQAKLDEYKRRMCNQFNSTVGTPGDKIVIGYVGSFIADITDITAEEFVDRYTQTIKTTIYPAKKFDTFTPWRQIKIWAHENRHSCQYQIEKEMAVKYMFKGLRALIEADACIANMELEYWRFGEEPDLGKIADGIMKYGLRKEDREVIVNTLRANLEITKQGAYASEQAKFAVKFLEDMGLVREIKNV